MATTSPSIIPRQILLRDLNPCVTCNLCGGYLIDATTLIDCLHVFCRACILRYFENSKLGCPTCNTVYKKKNHPCFRSDPSMQSLVYKLVPGLYTKEVQRREDFYRSTGVRASSSCSEDSVLGDLSEEHEEWVFSNIGDQNQYFSPDDSISLSLEYYQRYLEETREASPITDSTNIKSDFSKLTRDNNNSNKFTNFKTCANLKREKTSESVKSECGKDENSSSFDKDLKVKKELQSAESVEQLKGDSSKIDPECGSNNNNNESEVKGVHEATETKPKTDRRYLQCPAAVSMSHLQKFVRMKYALTADHRVDIIYYGEVLPSYFSLLDVAYIFNWQRVKPMRFFYRIFTPVKIQPIKIVNTSSTGRKKLQIMPVTPSPDQTQPPLQSPAESKNQHCSSDSDSQNCRNKERLMANLQLQSKNKIQPTPPQSSRYGKTYERSETEKNEHLKKSKALEKEANVVYEYEEPDKDEIREFAEKRDREWALQKQLDEEAEKHRVSKKRKKSKHSKSEFVHKKRKLHAEITSTDSSNREESLKLKVKLTSHNGHKHKHHKNLVIEHQPKQQELSSKEKLLQMRQVRHKNIAIEEKAKTGENNISASASCKKDGAEAPIENQQRKVPPDGIFVPSNPEKFNKACGTSKESEKICPFPPKKSETIATQTVSSSRDVSPKPTIKPEVLVSGKTLRSDFSNKTSASKDLLVHLERHEFGEKLGSKAAKQLEKKQDVLEKHAQKTAKQLERHHALLEKDAQKGASLLEKGIKLPDKHYGTAEKNAQKSGKFAQVHLERHDLVEKHAKRTFLKTFQSYTENLAETVEKKLPHAIKPLQNTKTVEQKIASLQQQCSITTKNGETQPARKVESSSKVIPNDKKPVFKAQYPTGFTVSKVETGIKRRLEIPDKLQDKRPSLEITLVPTMGGLQEVKTTKRPPPPTIPLDRIRKSINFKSGISITPKMQEKPDTLCPLDLSKAGKCVESIPKTIASFNRSLNGLNAVASKIGTNAQITPEPVPTPDKNIQLSNLQMLSKVATEHPTLNKTPPPTLLNNVKKPQVPNLQTLKIPSPQTPKSQNLAKLPKLNEISKTQFRMLNTQLRNMRPNQNQSVRNIPNPSLLVRQQNQNRLNSLTPGGNNNQNKEQVKNAEDGSPVLKKSASSGPSVAEIREIICGDAKLDSTT